MASAVFEAFPATVDVLHEYEKEERALTTLVSMFLEGRYCATAVFLPPSFTILAKLPGNDDKAGEGGSE